MTQQLIKGWEGPWCPDCEYPLKETPCSECARRAEVNAKVLERWKTILGGQKAWSEYTAERFVVTQYNKSAYDACLAFDPTKQNMLLTGPRGTGKSHARTIAIRPHVMKGVKTLTIFMQDELRAAKLEFKKTTAGEDRIAPMVQAPILSLEDIGVEKPSDWVVNEWYYPIIDGRYRACRNGLIITMNCSLDELETRWSPFDPYGRVVSRLKEMCGKNIFSLFGERDWREGR